MKNLKCEIAYCGTHYFGFQKTKMGPSIEESLEKALFKVLRHPVNIQVASRTDRGVHAASQWINFFTEKDPLDLNQLLHSLRSLLPRDIAPKSLQEAPNNFHPTLDAKGKVYCYEICNVSSQLPFHRKFSWHFPYHPLNIDAMILGAQILKGTHDFAAFTPQSYQDPTRSVDDIHIESLKQDRLRITIEGNKFLYKMVRTLVGTLVYVGCGKIPLQDLEKILKSKQREQAGMTAPAHGLTLKEVFY